MLKNNQDNLNQIFLELEQLDQEWSVKGVPDEYKNIWIPNNEVRLWSVPRTTGQLLRTFVLIKKPKLILEVGTSAGYSTLWLASAAATYGGKIHTIEATKPKIEMASRYFERSRLSESIIQIHDMADNALQQFAQPIDLFFLDADKSNYYKYLQIIEPKLAQEAVIIADNAVDFGEMMKDFTSYLLTNPAYETEILNFDHGVLVAVKK